MCVTIMVGTSNYNSSEQRGRRRKVPCNCVCNIALRFVGLSTRAAHGGAVLGRMLLFIVCPELTYGIYCGLRFMTRRY